MEKESGGDKITSEKNCYQLIPFDQETGNQPVAPEEFDSIEKAEQFLEKTKERWDGWKSVQIVEKQTGKVVDVW